MIYKTSLDNLAKGITAGVTILFATIIAGQNVIMKDAGRFTPVYTTVALVLAYFIPFAFRPVSYDVTGSQLIIHRLIKDVTIDRSNIKSIELIDREKIRGTIRIFGVGGLFGYFGNFANVKMGRMVWYATRRDRTVLVLTNDNKKIVLTPDDPAAFVSAAMRK